MIAQLNQLSRQFGIPFTALVCLVRLLQMIFDLSLAKVGTSKNVKNYAVDDDYENRMIDFEELRAALGQESDQFNAAFDRGDTCIATFQKQGGELAGYNFYTSCPTPVDDLIDFVFSHDYVYSYAAYTFIAHRGKGLSPSRWTSHREWRIVNGHNQSTIHYIDIQNTSSLASGDNTDTIVIGYTGYIKIWGTIWCWQSAGCKKTHSGFRVHA